MSDVKEVRNYEPINNVWEGHQFVYDLNNNKLFVKYETENGKIEYREGVRSGDTIIMYGGSLADADKNIVRLDNYDIMLFDKLYSRLWTEWRWKTERSIVKVNDELKSEDLFKEMINEKEASHRPLLYELFVKDDRCYYCSFEYGANSKKEPLTAGIFKYNDDFKRLFLNPFFMYQVGENDIDNILIDDVDQTSKNVNAFLINSNADVFAIKGIEKEYLMSLIENRKSVDNNRSR